MAISWLNPAPYKIAVYASPWSSPSTPQHSLSGGRYPLPEPDSHRLDHLSFLAHQWEAAEALGYGRAAALMRIVLPQCVARMVPPWMNLYALLITATPLASIVGVEEALSRTQAALQSEGQPGLLMPVYGALLILFFLYSYPVSRLSRAVERRFHRI